MKKNKKRKLDWADLACQQAMDRTLNQITVPEVFLKEENKLKKG
jgi:hypothetical protein|tara:strand:+ start:62 stop:193 length:132 start_codon:yes stop_codon:yes gene_type:complete